MISVPNGIVQNLLVYLLNILKSKFSEDDFNWLGKFPKRSGNL